MAPEIYKDGKLIADVPDETGWHEAKDGSPLYVNVDRIEARNGRQIVGLEGSSVEGERIVGLTQEGKGSSANVKKGGDGRESGIDVTLHERPIRISYRDRVWVERTRSLGEPRGEGYYKKVKRTYHNPVWMRR